ncbi:MAG: methionyl-tRNA formyltransferase [Bacteroidetes bacterium]|nr:methionyl-tRNA formyltransferase [Bacteroidota bacterium]
MRVIIFSGNHPRHLFINEEVIRLSNEVAVVLMSRESMIPEPPLNISIEDQRNFVRHFGERLEIENSTYGNKIPDEVFSKINVHNCEPQNLNSRETAEFVRNFSADVAFIFGVDMIREPVLSALPEIKINLHLGLSPWYRGAATLFWPFYFLQPQFAGATFHQITPSADAGEILHQSIPELRVGDGIHDVGVNTVIVAKRDLKKLFSNSYKKWNFIKQTMDGRLFLTRDFQPAHLRLIYDTFNNNIVDFYLGGFFEKREPKLILSPLVNSIPIYSKYIFS